ncbi:MAG: hypothetical protein AMR96_04275 [Candidatus Adiutrix intracellularis]|nr:MAG: hypothetical protein AMR96_04275 [Candidatus Adiutrix intracellularis]MDR2827474.1 hypothetical protein [Candidatus Adiutrix intracellularis]
MIILTIDTDWAPAGPTRIILEKVRALGIKTTVFFSTPSPLPSWPLLETGAHPDLSRRCVPDDGGGPLSMATLKHDADVLSAESQILQDYRTALPEAEAVRTHRFYWHSDLARVMGRTGFTHDSSLIIPYHPGLMGFKTGRLYRWPVWASDHLHLMRRFPLNRLALPYLDSPGLKIFCFHITYLYLNAQNLEDFNMIKTRLNNDHEPMKRAGPGIWNLFEMLAEKIYKTSEGSWLRDLPASHFLQNLELTNENNFS